MSSARALALVVLTSVLVGGAPAADAAKPATTAKLKIARPAGKGLGARWRRGVGAFKTWRQHRGFAKLGPTKVAAIVADLAALEAKVAGLGSGEFGGVLIDGTMAFQPDAETRALLKAFVDAGFSASEADRTRVTAEVALEIQSAGWRLETTTAAKDGALLGLQTPGLGDAQRGRGLELFLRARGAQRDARERLYQLKRIRTVDTRAELDELRGGRHAKLAGHREALLAHLRGKRAAMEAWLAKQPAAPAS
jgi:hypothetical protein